MTKSMAQVIESSGLSLDMQNKLTAAAAASPYLSGLLQTVRSKQRPQLRM